MHHYGQIYLEKANFGIGKELILQVLCLAVFSGIFVVSMLIST